MRIDRITACVQVRKDFGKCFDFYTETLGLVPIYGDRNSTYASFASYKHGVPFFGMYQAKDAAERVADYELPTNTASSDTLSATFHTADFDDVYTNWLAAGVEFIGKSTLSGEGFSFNIAYFRDPEGNLLSLEDGGV
ncbi:MAG: VOC family protein [Oscillospiraceae bacterium]|nr:VOC family protein [Oscillospiraceae bacterium]